MVPIKQMKEMRSYLNDPKLKKKMIAEAKKHEKLDAVVKMTYGHGEGKKWRGCAVGCSLKSLNRINDKEGDTSAHLRYESELGIPEAIAHLEDSLFEWMPLEDSKKFPRRFLEAVPVGADLSLVPAKFIVFVLNDALKNVTDADSACRKPITDIVQLWQDVIDGKEVKPSAWSAARSAAESAAESAARSAAWSAAGSAAWSAARSPA